MSDNNPLFPEAKQPDETVPVVLRGRREKTIQPLNSEADRAAVSLIRRKLDRLYAEEPDALKEEQEATAAKPRSKHQEFMYNLSNSGKSLADVQIAWHNYYLQLSDDEKHEVWQEFYETNSAASSRLQEAAKPAAATVRALEQDKEKIVVSNPSVTARSNPKPRTDPRSVQQIKKQLKEKVAAVPAGAAKRNLKSLAVGLSTGMVVVAVLLFGSFNEIIIAPFIQPSRTVSATPIIVNTSSSDAYKDPRIIIPKINIEIPVDYSQSTIDEAAIQGGLQNGVVHYPITVNPGENGNAAFFGHSSSNILNNGKYKFAFVLLHDLEVGDTFYLTKDGKIYIYQIFSKHVVPPTDVSVLDNISGETATATLITCDPPGFNTNRLIVVGRQISPDPSANATTGTNTASTALPAQTVLPGNGESLPRKIWHWIF